MKSPEESLSPLSLVSTPSSLYSPLSENYALLNEKLNVHQHVRRIPMRHRAWCLLFSMIATGMLFARVIWTLTPMTVKHSHAGPLEAQIAWDLAHSDAAPFVLPANVRVVALVSYTLRRRTSILDCYLQSNLAINDGLLDQVIFIPETGQERDMDWLHALVQSTPGYFMLGKPKHDSGDDIATAPITGGTGAQISELHVGSGPFARAWSLALRTTQPQADDGPGLGTTSSPDSDLSTIFIFIHDQTVFLAPDAISHLLQAHFTHPSYAFVHANMINQPVLSWIHHHLGVVRPYRPETEPPIRSYRNKTAIQEAKANTQHPWRASELPLWRDSHLTAKDFVQDAQSPDEPAAKKPQDFPPVEGPSLFNIPIDFHSPFRGHRWLPYHPYQHHPLSEPQQDDPSIPPSDVHASETESESISTPITQAMMSLQRPGKWPWTLSALHLYSFLEHLECTPPHSYITALLANTTEAEGKGKYNPNCTLTGGLDRYNMGLWEYQSEKYGMSFFAMDSRTINKIGALPFGVSEGEILGRAGMGAAFAGGSMAVRFIGSSSVADGLSETRGLESTDLLARFESVSREAGGCDVHGVLR